MTSIIAPCWCGEQRGRFVFDDPEPCGGLGVIQCTCGGDQCVCHHHGEYECPGCVDCRDEDGPDNFGFDEDGRPEPEG